MASSNQEKSNSQTESPPLTNQSSEQHTDPPPPPPTTTHPTHPLPHPMYYQNPHAYPQYPPGYPPGYHYPQNAPYYGPPPTYQTSSSGTRFIRSFILCFMMILAFFFLSSLFLALMLRPQLPVYKVVSLNVNNFTTTPTLAGQWDTKISIDNPNDKLVAYFSNFKVDVAYKDGVMAINHAPGFVLNTNDHMDVNVAGLSNQGNVNLLEKTTMDDLVKERGTGSVTFTLRVSSVNVFKSGSISTRTEEIVAICEGLKVVFQNNNATTGTMDNRGKPVDCQLYI